MGTPPVPQRRGRTALAGLASLALATGALMAAAAPQAVAAPATTHQTQHSSVTDPYSPPTITPTATASRPRFSASGR